METKKNQAVEIDVSDNIPDEIMEKYPTQTLGETTAIVITPEETPERDFSDFEI